MQPRRLHYAFSHQLLPKQAHADPARVVAELRTPLRDGFLFFLWERLGEELGAPDLEGAVGLTVAGVDEQDGDTYALVAMPAPLAEGESHYLAIVHRPGRTQVFVLDRTESEGEGSLAKLGPDGSRLSYGRVAVSQGTFLQQVVELVRTEPDASPGGAGGSFGAVWGPSSPSASAPKSMGAVWGPPGGSPPASGPASVGSVWGPPGGSSGGPGAGAAWGGGAAQPKSVGAVWGPSSAAPKKKSGGGCAVPILGCVGLIVVGVVLLGVATFDSGDSFDDTPFQLTAALVTSPDGEESVSLERTGGPSYAYYELTGPGDATRCRFSYYGSSACLVPVGALDERTLRYELAGSGSPPRLFGFAVGDTPRATHGVTVERTTSLAWSSSRNATVCIGARCKVELDAQGQLHLRDAAPGATLHVGVAPPGLVVPIDIVAEADRVGVARLLAAPSSERASIPGVRVTLPDGTTIAGAVEVPITTLASLVVRRLSQLENADLGPAEGAGGVWIEDGRFRAVEGAPARLQDIGTVVTTTTREIAAGQCGPYAVWGVGTGSRLPRTRTEVSVVVYDRRAERVVTRRTFRGATPSCPYSVSVSDRSVQHRDTADADAFTRAQLQGG